MLAEDLWKTHALRIFRLEHHVFPKQLLAFDSAREDLLQVIEVERLLDEVIRSFAHSGDGLRDSAVSSHHDDRDGRIVVEVTATGDETRAGRMSIALEEALAANTQVADMARRVADRFVAAARAMQQEGWWWSGPALTNKSIKRRILREIIAHRF